MPGNELDPTWEARAIFMDDGALNQSDEDIPPAERGSLHETEIDYLTGLGVGRVQFRRGAPGIIIVHFPMQRENAGAFLVDTLGEYGAVVGNKTSAQYEISLVAPARGPLINAAGRAVKLPGTSWHVCPYMIGAALANEATFPSLQFDNGAVARKTATILRATFIPNLEDIKPHQRESGNTYFELIVPDPARFLTEVRRMPTLQLLPPKALLRFDQLRARVGS